MDNDHYYYWTERADRVRRTPRTDPSASEVLGSSELSDVSLRELYLWPQDPANVYVMAYVSRIISTVYYRISKTDFQATPLHYALWASGAMRTSDSLIFGDDVDPGMTTPFVTRLYWNGASMQIRGVTKGTFVEFEGYYYFTADGALFRLTP